MLSSNHIPEGWVESTLNELAFINPRESIRKGELAKNVPMDCIDSFTRKISRFGIKEFKGGTKFKNKDTLLARITPCLENGKTALVDILDKDEIGFGSTEYIVIRENNDKSHYKFLYYLSISPKFRRNAIKAMTGTSGRQRVQTDVLINKVFRFPPLPEQKSIAKVLTAFDDKIELLQAQNKTLESMAQTIFKEWFGKYQIGDELPDGWKVGRLRDLGDIICGKTPSKADKENFGGNIPFIKIPDMHNQMFIIKTSDSLTKKGVSTQKNKLIPKNSICVSCIATVGLVSITSKDSQTNQQINSILPFNDSCREFIYFKVKGLHKYLQDIGSGGTATLNVNTRSFSNIEIIIPNIKKLNAFNIIVNPMFEKIFDNYSQIESLTKTRDTLLPKLMSGQVRVNKLKQTADA